MMGLSELRFSDLFLPARIEEAWYKETPNALDRIPVPPALADDVRRLRREMESAASSPDFRIDFDGIRATIRAGDPFTEKRDRAPEATVHVRGVP